MGIFNFMKKPKSGIPDETKTSESIKVDTSTATANIDNAEAATAEKGVATRASRRVFNLIILDASGSMSAIYRPALSGVNETLQTIREARRENDNQEHFVSLITFNSGHFNAIYRHRPAEKAEDITSAQYSPCGCTPLYDAMGRAITELQSKIKDDDVVLVTVITDGYENSSQEYTGKAIKALVEQLKEQGWVFTYIGANQDVEAVAGSMSIDNKLAFAADEESTRAMFSKECRSRKAFFGKLHDDIQISELKTGYFDEEDEN